LEIDWKEIRRMAAYAQTVVPIKAKCRQADAHDLLLCATIAQQSDGDTARCWNDALNRFRREAGVRNPAAYFRCCVGTEIGIRRGDREPEERGFDIYRELRRSSGLAVPQCEVDLLLSELRRDGNGAAGGPESGPGPGEQTMESRVTEYLAGLSAADREALRERAIAEAPGFARKVYLQAQRNGNDKGAIAQLMAMEKAYVRRLVNREEKP
jgi:hypothetical protein